MTEGIARGTTEREMNCPLHLIIRTGVLDTLLQIHQLTYNLTPSLADAIPLYTAGRTCELSMRPSDPFVAFQSPVRAWDRARALAPRAILARLSDAPGPTVASGSLSGRLQIVTTPAATRGPYTGISRARRQHVPFLRFDPIQKGE
ncbi:hypothetical protein PCASD_00311 [Puccinia coronata f. sp. avenae]|uniref:Uncharacterized protein n=1 Tax=Puccinia coronata f. sp. avenae TaxID=200324 RepID=A0A2N5VNF3_9BASI|nr:hypothetical protein PCASD_00311 [Puccinia coronata f. sp. avenae]